LLVVVAACGRLGFDADPNDVGGSSDAPGLCYGSSPDTATCFDAPLVKTAMLAGSFDTDSSPSCAGNVMSGPAGCVIAGSQIVTTGDVSVTGSRPLVVIADELTVDSLLDVASHVGGKTGPGADIDCRDGTQPTGLGGGAGGSFGGTGGAGADSGSNGHGGIPGEPIKPTTIRGGCAGQAADGGAEGAGGGGVLIVANTVNINGVINASGAGAAAAIGLAGAGGGAGGMIAIDAATIHNNGVIMANGGGGGGAGGAGADPDSANPYTDAPGGSNGCNPLGSGAGAGAAGPTHDAAAAEGGCSLGGDGGGGGAGVILFYQAAATGNVSPT